MRCTSPRTVGFKSDGTTLCWSPKKYSKEFAPFQIPCGKCISCRLENARQTAVRCVHEASVYEKNSFLTLTYSDEYMGDGKLDYRDIQKFTKGLRDKQFQSLLETLYPNDIYSERRKKWRELDEETKKYHYDTIRTSILTTGEYGPETKRKHWHLLVFNWRPDDATHQHTTPRGDKIFTSDILRKLWPYGHHEIGEITFESAGYCARYALKKLDHGHDGKHDYNPISRRSCKNAIGKKWIEQNYKDVFNSGVLVFRKGDQYIQCGIPRYYEKWFQKHKPDEWRLYRTKIKQNIIDRAQAIEAKADLLERRANAKRSGLKGLQISRNKQRDKILRSKIKQLKQNF